MPTKPPLPCKYPGCPNLTNHPRGFCPEHLPLRYREEDTNRPNAYRRGYTKRWQKASKIFLHKHPLCAACLSKDPPEVKAATVVDHIKPHKGDYTLFWDETNWQSLCEECHNRKSATE